VDENSALFERVLNALNAEGVLDELVLLGSWCLAVYSENYGGSPEIPLLRTLDVDFLVPNPIRTKKKADIPELLKELGFDVVYSVVSGYSKFVHPELEIEFLTPEVGRGRSTPYKVTALKITAQGLRYVGLADQYAVEMHYRGIKVRVPHPAAFVLLKLLTSEKRKKLTKKERDVSTAVQLAEFILSTPAQTDKFREIWSSLPQKWRSTVLRIADRVDSPLSTLLEV
jgi:hypothetical protein